MEDRSLKLDDIILDDMGEYTCEADNAVGSIAATGILTVHGRSCLCPRLMCKTPLFLPVNEAYSSNTLFQN